jgi:hypothetical protein
MAQSPIVYVLAEKRAEIAGLIIDLDRRTRQARADLVHVDATLHLFDPGIRPRSIKAERPASQRLGYLQPGEISQRCREAIRDA